MLICRKDMYGKGIIGSTTYKMMIKRHVALQEIEEKKCPYRMQV